MLIEQKQARPSLRLVRAGGLLWLIAHVSFLLAAWLYTQGIPRTPDLVAAGTLLEAVCAISLVGSAAIVANVFRGTVGRVFGWFRILAASLIGTAAISFTVLVDWLRTWDEGPPRDPSLLVSLHDSATGFGYGLIVSTSAITLGMVLIRRAGRARMLGTLMVLGGALTLVGTALLFLGILDLDRNGALLLLAPVVFVELILAGFLLSGRLPQISERNLVTNEVPSNHRERRTAK